MGEKRFYRDELYTSQVVERHMSIGLATMLLLEAPLASIHSRTWIRDFEGFVIRASSHGILTWKDQCFGYDDRPFTYFKLCDSDPKLGRPSSMAMRFSKVYVA